MFSKFGTRWMVACMSKTKAKLRKYLNADALFSLVRSGFERILNHRSNNIEIPLADALMSAFAMFFLKDPSLLTFEARRSGDTNLKTVYKINTVHCDFCSMKTNSKTGEIAYYHQLISRRRSPSATASPED